jgi:hypothetical protein
MIGLNNLTTNSLSFIEGQNNHLEEVCVKLCFIDYDMPNEKDKKGRKGRVQVQIQVQKLHRRMNVEPLSPGSAFK